MRVVKQKYAPTTYEITFAMSEDLKDKFYKLHKELASSNESHTARVILENGMDAMTASSVNKYSEEK